MSKFTKKSWADLAYESSSDSDLEENSLPIQKTQSQTVQNLLQKLPSLIKSTSLNEPLPRYFQRVLKAVQDQNDSIVEVAIRDCPKGVTEQNLKDALPIVSCTITDELVTVFVKKEDIIDHLYKKQLQQIILNQMCTLCIQNPTEDTKRVEAKTDVQTKAVQKSITTKDRQREGINGFKQRKFPPIYQQKRQDD